jgi:hypothetical protein
MDGKPGQDATIPGSAEEGVGEDASLGAAPAAFLHTTEIQASRAKSLLKAAGGPNQYTPPAGARWGYDNHRQTIASSIGNLLGCDILAKNRTVQHAVGEMAIDFYGYWTDGESKPCYVLVVEQRYMFNPALKGPGRQTNNAEGTLTWDPVSKTWFMHTIEARSLRPKVLGAGSDQVTLEAWGPQTAQDGTQTYTTEFTVNLRRETSGGAREKSPVTLNSGAITNKFPDWSSLDKSDVHAGRTCWQYCQKKGWDSRVKPTGDFHTWWADVYENSFRDFRTPRIVADIFPAQSREQFDFKTVSVWRIPCGSSIDPSTGVAPPPALSVELEGGLDVHMVGFHSPFGCTNHKHHMYPFGVLTGWKKTIDLQKLVSQ